MVKELLIEWKEAAPAAGAITAVLSALVALTVLRYTRAANRRRATLDMVMKTLMDDSVQAKYATFKSVLSKDKNTADEFKIESLLLTTSVISPERRAVLAQLNVYELMALGIRRGIFDEAFYKRWYHNQFMIDYEGAQAFISGLQANKPSIFWECSNLYRKWDKSGHPESTPSAFKMAWWAIMKQNDKIDRARAAAKAR
ncbi:DUF4760 domain-containing protein [Sphingomonas phyllosphaerae]|uniref:DUF4760 domain-containing protein n=1 Tax=Sphingomonas phyllosphaerae TaxID=257003 RepID=UPI0018CA5139|nr:DUF4760 domain-containing protein [Sphingomonas phyllosphaerae]